MINLLAVEDERMSLKAFLCSKFYRDGGWELCKGELVLMSPARIPHSRVSFMVGYLFRRFIEANGLSCKVNGSDAAVRLWEDNSFIQSDISVCCDDSIIDDGWFLRVPEIVVEVLSKSTKAYCQGEKLEIYREFGAKEYWMVDIENRTVRVEYFVDGSASVYKPGDVIHSKFFDGLAILADDVFKNM